MKRREAIKLTALATLGVAVSASACPSGSCDMDSKKNRKLMVPKDASNLTKGELKHTPQITLGDTDANGYTLVEITVGQGGIIHPSTKGHWIDFISLYVDKKLVGKTELMAEISRGAAAFRVNLKSASYITANAGCNLHGIWTSTVKL
ncbi:twin-arginine translocation pathway signal protein [Sulfurimonas sp. SAG-AH-194-L11]|nr:desulfoferrodoxin family protein [Sulfurimonas sp. SAG-AH-194-L11]MDF1877589.1 twin-arginine translocation pathway signal protein [Sulfurimonas sp. SAG-AH-194-L11]